MQLLYGTGNLAKLDSMAILLKSLGINLYGLKDIQQTIPNVIEDGNSPLENARIKANTYFKAFEMPVFSCDSGLYFDGLPDNLQPKTYVRNINGKCLSDDEMITHYSGLASQYGTLKARYKNAICMILDENTCIESMDDSLSGEYFHIVNKAHAKITAGFPLDSLSVNIKTGLYYFDMESASVGNECLQQGFYHFFKNMLSTIK